MVRNLRVAAATAVLILAAAVPAAPTSAQKSGGVLKIQQWDRPASIAPAAAGGASVKDLIVTTVPGV
jgi:hypothetical protein